MRSLRTVVLGSMALLAITLTVSVGLSTPRGSPDVIEIRRQALSRPDPKTLRHTSEHRVPNAPPDPDDMGASAPSLLEPAVYALPSGLTVREHQAESEFVSHTVITYVIHAIRAESDWAFVGLKVGDRILSINGRPLGLIEASQRLEMLSDPDAELQIIVNQPDGGYYSARTTLNNALRDGLPEPRFRPEDLSGWPPGASGQ